MPRSAKVHALESVFNKRTQEFMDQERTNFQSQLVDFATNSAKKEMKGTSKQLNDSMKAVTEVNTPAERVENKAVEYKEQMNQAPERLAEFKGQFLSFPRRNVLIIGKNILSPMKLLGG